MIIMLVVVVILTTHRRRVTAIYGVQSWPVTFVTICWFRLNPLTKG
jgi:hypothetical protein